jgi:predicted methyltransferase
MSILIEQVVKNSPGLKYAEVEGLLYILSKNQGLTNTRLIQLTGLPKETLKDFKSSISNLLEDRDGEFISLNQEGRNFLSTLEVSPYRWSLLEYSDSAVENKLKLIRENSGVSSKREYDQFFATENTSYAKAALLQDKSLITNKKITLLGDDDLLALTIPFLSTKYARIDVYDVDEQLLDFVKEEAEKLGIKRLYTHKYDVRNELQADFFTESDVVVLDPPYTKSGVKTFINRALGLLGSANKEDKYLIFYYGNSFKSPEKTLKIQELINEFGLLVEDKIDKFARYNGGESIGSASSVYVLRVTKHTHALENSMMDDTIYTYQDQKEERFPAVEHVTAKVFDVPKNIVSSKKAILRAFGEFSNTHDLKVLQKNITKFKGGGLSLTFILANSNLLVHTWPEYNAVHVDLLTCTVIKDKKSIAKTLSRLLKTKKILVNNIE